MKQILLMLQTWWFDLLYTWRRNSVSFFINEKGDLQLISDDDTFNFEAPECEEIVTAVVLSFPSEEFSLWLRANVCGIKMSKCYSVEYAVSPSGKVVFDTNTFKSSSWNMKII